MGQKSLKNITSILKVKLQSSTGLVNCMQPIMSAAKCGMKLIEAKITRVKNVHSIVVSDTYTYSSFGIEVCDKVLVETWKHFCQTVIHFQNLNSVTSVFMYTVACKTNVFHADTKQTTFSLFLEQQTLRFHEWKNVPFMLHFNTIFHPLPFPWHHHIVNICETFKVLLLNLVRGPN